MDLFKYKKQMWKNNDEPILIKEIKLPKDHFGWLVIDSLGYGSSGGGIRLGKTVNLEEVRLLAQEMTLKRLFYNESFGGAKAGIYCPYPLKYNDREKIFKYFGKVLKPFLHHKIYYPGTDLGTNRNDIDHLFKGAGIVADYVAEDSNDYIDSSYYTAISVFSVLKSLATYKKLKLNDTRLGIQGLGKVGLKLLQLASDHGVKLVAGSTQHGALYSPHGLDIMRIFDLAKNHGDEFVNFYGEEHKMGLDEFFEKDMDILCPCAGIYPINEDNIGNIMVKIIVPGCNVAATEKIEQQLYEKGITYLPGFVCNAGGVLGYTLRRFGIDKSERANFLSRGIQKKVDLLLRQSEEHRKAPSDIARSIVSQNHENFVLESKARMNGRLSMLNARRKNSGLAEVIGTILLELIDRKLIVPNYLRKNLAKKIVFNRVFNSTYIYR